MEMNLPKQGHLKFCTKWLVKFFLLRGKAAGPGRAHRRHRSCGNDLQELATGIGRCKG